VPLASAPWLGRASRAATVAASHRRSLGAHHPTMSALGHKRTLRRVHLMSALPPKADMIRLVSVTTACDVSLISDRLGPDLVVIRPDWPSHSSGWRSLGADVGAALSVAVLKRLVLTGYFLSCQRLEVIRILPSDGCSMTMVHLLLVVSRSRTF
jgi:hypothetical protein